LRALILEVGGTKKQLIMNKIKIEDILMKYMMEYLKTSTVPEKYHESTAKTWIGKLSKPNPLFAAIKELIDTAIEKCEEKALLRVTPYDEEEYTNTSIKSDWANKQHVDGFEVDVDKQSILQVKEMFDYE